MLLRVDILSQAIESVKNYQKAKLLFPSPRGVHFNATHAKDLAFLNQDLIFLWVL